MYLLYLPKFSLATKKKDFEFFLFKTSAFAVFAILFPLSAVMYTFSRKYSTADGINFSSGANQTRGDHCRTNFSTVRNKIL